MKDWLLLLAGICVILSGCFLAYPMLKRQALLEINGQAPIMEASVVVTSSDGGKGSGVHIGGGFVITAAHVVGRDPRVKLGYYKGGTQEAEVLWANADYDVALIYVQRRRWAESAPLDCAPNFVGQRVRLVGNPMDLDFVYSSATVMGHQVISGRTILVPLDGTAVYGQSGGGAIDANGKTVGIAAAVMTTPKGIAAFSYMVPATVICRLMGVA
jgi:S1-C subfamily serine protease